MAESDSFYRMIRSSCLEDSSSGVLLEQPRILPIIPTDPKFPIPEDTMKILLSIIIATILLTLPSVAQKRKSGKSPAPKQVGVVSVTEPVFTEDTSGTVIRILKTDTDARFGGLTKVPSPTDTTLVLLHADHTTRRTSGGVEYITYEGDVQARILGYYIVADRVEVVSDPLRIVAEGNAAVMSDDMAEFVKRFEWKKSDPDSPIIRIRTPPAR